MRIKQSAVAGMFYPDNPDELALMVSQLLADNPQQGRLPVAIQVPHAGLVYSGGIAAKAYNLIRPYLDSITRIVLLGPAHRVPLQGMAVMDAGLWQTPLGQIQIDNILSDELVREGWVSVNDQAHAQEHCLEVQLPFLQLLDGRYRILPVLVGQTPSAAVSALVAQVLEMPGTLLVISSDLSHFHPYSEACQLDRATQQQIAQLDSQITPQQACGCYALNGFLRYAQSAGLKAELLGYCNSGDTAGDKSRVVGYSSYAFY
jgi:AmmeMemoRadiSam system protein B